MGKTFRYSTEDRHVKEKSKHSFVLPAFCLDCKQTVNECPEDHLCPNCGSWLVEIEE
jgi:rRNA maturation endonuclease Nob1